MQIENGLIVVWALTYGAVIIRLIQVEHRLAALEFETRRDRSAEAKAIERIKNPNPVEWETVGEPGQEIDIDKINERLKKRGYNIQISCKDSLTD